MFLWLMKLQVTLQDIVEVEEMIVLGYRMTHYNIPNGGPGGRYD